MLRDRRDHDKPKWSILEFFLWLLLIAGILIFIFYIYSEPAPPVHSYSVRAFEELNF